MATTGSTLKHLFIRHCRNYLHQEQALARREAISQLQRLGIPTPAMSAWEEVQQLVEHYVGVQRIRAEKRVSFPVRGYPLPSGMICPTECCPVCDFVFPEALVETVGVEQWSSARLIQWLVDHLDFEAWAERLMDTARVGGLTLHRQVAIDLGNRTGFIQPAPQCRVLVRSTAVGPNMELTLLDAPEPERIRAWLGYLAGVTNDLGWVALSACLRRTDATRVEEGALISIPGVLLSPVADYLAEHHPRAAPPLILNKKSVSVGTPNFGGRSLFHQ